MLVNVLLHLSYTDSDTQSKGQTRNIITQEKESSFNCKVTITSTKAQLTKTQYHITHHIKGADWRSFYKGNLINTSLTSHVHVHVHWQYTYSYMYLEANLVHHSPLPASLKSVPHCLAPEEVGQGQKVIIIWIFHSWNLPWLRFFLRIEVFQ